MRCRSCVVLGAALAFVGCAVGWFVSGGWHTDELIVINYADRSVGVSVKDSEGNIILPLTHDFISDVKYDMIPVETGFVIEIDGTSYGGHGYAMKCDSGPQFLLLTKEGVVKNFYLSDDAPTYLKRRLKCLLKYGK